MMIVISDTSPISSLFLVGHIHLLPKIFGRVIIPQEVFSELLILETGFDHDLSKLKNAPWLEVGQVKDLETVKRLKKVLDDGESEAIVLAKELEADYLLIDEHEGREVATAEGLKIIGVLGVLIQAKANGQIPLVRPVMDDLQTTAKFRISESLYHHVLAKVGEQ